MNAPSVISLATLQRAEISASEVGSNEIVAPVSGCIIIVASYLIAATSPGTARWRSSGGSNLSGALPLPAAGDGYSGVDSSLGHFATPSGHGLDLDLGDGAAVEGHINYWIVRG